MKPEIPSSVSNRLLASLPGDEYDRLLSKLQTIRLPRNRIVYEVGEETRYVYFPTHGMASLLAIMEEGETIEIGTIGNEGFIGVPVIHEVRKAPYRVMVQLPMLAHYLESEVLLNELGHRSELRRRLLNYAHLQEVQLTQAVPCALFHSVEQRLARRLMAMGDSLDSDTFEVT